MMNLLGFIMSLVYMQALHGWLSAYERLVNSQNSFSPYLTQEDLSRLGRDYLKVGYYTEIAFPEANVRFISVNDGFDSSNPLDIDSLDTSFRTLIYDLYSRDLSRRVKNAKKSTGRVRGISQSLCAVWIRQRPGGQKSSSDRYRSRRGDTAHLSNGSGWCKNMGDCGGAER